MMIKFTIDPGHFTNYNTGVVPGYYEGNMTYRLAGYLKTALEQYNEFTVALTKTSLGSNPSLDVRGRYAINNNSNVFISLHSNAASGNASGVVMFRSLKRPDSVNLGNALGQSVANLMDTNYRGLLTRVYPNTKNTDYYGVIRAAVRSGNIPYVYIIEHGFHTNAKECVWLYNDDNLKKLAETEAAVFAGYFHATKKGANVICDTTNNFSVKKGATYQFKLTASKEPVFKAGTSGIFDVVFSHSSGRDYFYTVMAVGAVGKATGFYINDSKIPAVVVTIA